MRYVGGKAKLWSRIVPLFGPLDESTYIEPFVGSATVLAHVKARVRIANDSHPYLIALLSAVSTGWVPPSNVSEFEYKAIQRNPENYPAYLVGFIGFACSFGAKWFGGYARGAQRNYADESSRNLVRQSSSLQGVHWTQGSYINMNIPKDECCVIYCDPPYQGTTPYSLSTFNHEQFWAWCNSLVDKGHQVYVSEYTAPSEWTSVWSHRRAASLDRNTGGKYSTEHVFVR